jgi:hypothetical protein
VKHIRLWAGLGVIAVLAAVAAWGWWSYDLRWRPANIEKEQAAIGRLLDQAGWVSPGLTGPKLYMVAARDCPACDQFRQASFADLQAAGVDTRLVMVAPADENGVGRSTPIERSTVAELWVNRSWALSEDWLDAPPETWKAAGVAQADGDVARTAVVEAGRRMVEDLRPLMRKNGVKLDYPLLVWWTRDGEMRACACTDPRMYKYVRRDLGLED